MKKIITIFLYFYYFFLSEKISSYNVEQISNDLLKSKYNNDLYLSFYKIPLSLMTFSTNGGQAFRHEISKAFDNDYSTDWQAKNLKSLNILTNVKITFSKTVTIDRMIYQAPIFYGIEGYGYPIELKVYIKIRGIDGNISTDESDFLLIDDIISEKTGNLVLFTFGEEITCDQIKLEWTNIEQSDGTTIFPSASEIMLLFPENQYINELIDAFYPNDYTLSLIKPEYNDINIIEGLIENIKEYYDISETIQEIVSRIKNITNGEIIYDPKREFTTNQSSIQNIIYQYGDINYYSKKILKMSRGTTNRQSTGIYGLSNEKIVIYVDANDDEINLPSIRFSQFIGNYNKWLSSPYILKKGKNILIFDNYNTLNYGIKVNPGGPIYIENKFTPQEQSQKIRIYIEGGILFPLFRKGDDEEEFRNTLSQYILKYNDNIDTYLNITELESEKIMITISATDAYDNYVTKNKSPQNNLVYWDLVLKEYYIFDGIQFEENQPYYDYKNNYLKLHIRYSQQYKSNILAYAYTEHIGIFKENEIYRVMVSYEGIRDVLAHEVGHMIDVEPREIAEETNNVLKEYSLEVIDKYRGYRDSNYDFLVNGMVIDNINTLERGCSIKNKSECNGLFTSYNRYKLCHLLWWDIESLYHGYWGKLDNLYRYNYSMVYEMTKTEGLVYFSSYITGLDLGYYFERFGFVLGSGKPFNNSDTSDSYNERKKELIDNGKINPFIQKKFWYIDIDEYNYITDVGTGCYNNNENYNIEIIDIIRNDTIKCYNITLPSINCIGHLGFEIYDNDTIIGFSHKQYYNDFTKYFEGYKPNYKIVAYDRLLDYSRPSEYKKAPDSPTLNIQNKKEIKIFNNKLYYNKGTLNIKALIVSLIIICLVMIILIVLFMRKKEKINEIIEFNNNYIKL